MVEFYISYLSELYLPLSARFFFDTQVIKSYWHVSK